MSQNMEDVKKSGDGNTNYNINMEKLDPNVSVSGAILYILL